MANIWDILVDFVQCSSESLCRVKLARIYATWELNEKWLGQDQKRCTPLPSTTPFLSLSFSCRISPESVYSRGLSPVLNSVFGECGWLVVSLARMPRTGWNFLRMKISIIMNSWHVMWSKIYNGENCKQTFTIPTILARAVGMMG